MTQHPDDAYRKSSLLFHRAGFIPLSEYVEDIEYMRERGPWKLPMRFMDRLHFWLLTLVARYSWFAELLFVLHPHAESPAYTALLKYLKRNGITEQFMERTMRYPGAYSYYFETTLSINGNKTYMNAQGIGSTPSLALSKAIGEMVERMVSGTGDKNSDVIRGSVIALKKQHKVWYPPKYHRFLDIQKQRYPILDTKEDEELDWVKGKNLITHETTLIPKQVTSWFAGSRSGGKMLLNSTTNGAAGYFTHEGATLRGLFEVIQRDGFFVHWLTRTPPRYIEQSSLPEELREQVRIFTALGVEVHLLDIASMGVPVVCVAGITRAARVPQVTVSAAAGTSYVRAAKDALREMIGGVEALYRSHQKPLRESGAYEPFVSDLNKITRQLYWRGEERVGEFEWFIGGEKRELPALSITSEEVPSDGTALAACLAILKARGEAYYPLEYVPQNPITSHIGFSVVQTYIPKAFPMYLVEKYGTFDSDRLTEFREERGLSSSILNPDPHLFS